jgi:hypothetical protein
MRVELIDGIPGFYDGLIAADSGATFFHRPEWIRLIEASIPGWRFGCLVAQNGGSRPTALPFMRRRVRGAVVLASMPFGTYGSLLGERSDLHETAGPLFEAFFRLARQPRVVYSEIVDLHAHAETLALPGLASRTLDAYVVNLSADAPYTWQRMRPSARNKVRKARRAGVRVRRASDASDFRWFHGVLDRCSTRWSSRCRLTPTFFDGLWSTCRTHVDMWIGELDDARVAGLLNVNHNGTVV